MSMAPANVTIRVQNNVDKDALFSITLGPFVLFQTVWKWKHVATIGQMLIDSAKDNGAKPTPWFGRYEIIEGKKDASKNPHQH